MKLRQLAPILLVALTPSIPREIGACSLAPRDGGGWYEEPLYGDSTPPTQPSVSYSILWTAQAHGGSVGCTASCGPGPAYVLLELGAADDKTPAERIGYKFAIASGRPPKNLQYDQILTVDPYSRSGTELGLAFDTDSGPFSFDLEITAVDQNGNESVPVVIEIEG